MTAGGTMKATPRERLNLTGELTDGLTIAGASLTPAQEAELGRRMETFDVDTKSAKPWALIKAERNKRAR